MNELATDTSDDLPNLVTASAFCEMDTPTTRLKMRMADLVVKRLHILILPLSRFFLVRPAQVLPNQVFGPCPNFYVLHSVSGVTYFNGAGRFDRYLDIPDKNRTFRFREEFRMPKAYKKVSEERTRGPQVEEAYGDLTIWLCEGWPLRRCPGRSGGRGFRGRSGRRSGAIGARSWR